MGYLYTVEAEQYFVQLHRNTHYGYVVPATVQLVLVQALIHVVSSFYLLVYAHYAGGRAGARSESFEREVSHRRSAFVGQSSGDADQGEDTGGRGGTAG